MYKFSSKLKTFSIALMVIGILGVGYGFFSAPKTVEDVKEMLHDSHDSHHGGESKAHLEKEALAKIENHGHEADASHGDTDAHAEHALHQLQNRPWSALYVSVLFFALISLGVLVFYALQHVSQAGWSIVLLRVMEGITAYLPVGTVLLFVFLVLSSMHANHLFAWMDSSALDPNNPNYDKLLVSKSGYLNIPFFLARAVVYIIGWNLYRHLSRKRSIAMDSASNLDIYKRNFKRSAGFLVFFLVSESMMSWDWIMSIDHHWFSTLFAWYVFASFLVSAVTTIALVTVYLKSKGYLENVNDSHIHDLAKFMFGFSVFWTYLWFSQFLLIWYSDIPEEVTYYVTRFNEYKLPFLGMVGMNFVFPILLLINSDYKRIPWLVVMGGIVILAGHYVDFFVMIMPGTVGENWSIGIPEISAVLLMLGLFIYVAFTALTKAPLLAKGNPFLKESEQFHY
ncbi:quinol:cytochrome C oxidoreductase [Aureivirga marina]|uniref:quinol:cytochrome C oxidoreductase n=1 Tax=Aureivirga marina TaxID=1182451 RepID=UPI0018CBC0A0|nr:quinol:cytochrome C oxidoreductase [Aureivirga marina]